MDDLLAAINKTNFDGLYKSKGDLDNQEQRRKEMLVVQKSNRKSLMDEFRGIVKLVEAVQSANIYHGQKAMYRPQIYVAGFNRCAYEDVLMKSEWMVEKPHDFHENWFVVPCPKGFRTLVVASQGTTKLYSKQGYLRMEVPTALPGGSPVSPGRNSRCCILDCIFSEKPKVMYILDLLAWNSHTMADGETDFRHYWMLTHLSEMPELQKISRNNKLLFTILPKVPCDPDNFSEFMMRYPHFPNFTPNLDGLLFYHKMAHYVSGKTPLVGWLKPYMVPEVFGNDVPINPAYLLEKPLNYLNQADFIEKFEIEMAEREKKIKAKRRYYDPMDTAPMSPSYGPVDMDTQAAEPVEFCGAKDLASYIKTASPLCENIGTWKPEGFSINASGAPPNEKGAVGGASFLGNETPVDGDKASFLGDGAALNASGATVNKDTSSDRKMALINTLASFLADGNSFFTDGSLPTKMNDQKTKDENDLKAVDME